MKPVAPFANATHGELPVRSLLRVEHVKGALGLVVGIDGQQVAEHDEGALGARKPRGLLRLWQQKMLELRIAELPSLAR